MARRLSASVRAASSARSSASVTSTSLTESAGESIVEKMRIGSFFRPNKEWLDTNAAANRCLPVPLATGMSLSLCLSALRRLRPHADVVVVSRIDQKSCIKAVSHAGLKLQVVDQVVGSDGALVTDLDAIQSEVAFN
ncbi:hypothetical protein ACSSS7_001114 [Eimeria intestinalis]